MPTKNGSQWRGRRRSLDGSSCASSMISTRCGHTAGSSRSGSSCASDNSSVSLPVSLYSCRPSLEIVFDVELDAQYECPVCAQVLRYPVQFEGCGHRCCSSCLTELLRVTPRCPIDQSHIERDKVLVDKDFQREIEFLGVKCSYGTGGCDWTGHLRELTIHLEGCRFRVVACPKGCDAEFEKRFLEGHLNDDCPKRDIACEFCKSRLNKEEEVSHLRRCHKFPLPCPNSCDKKEVIREQLETHLAEECPKAQVNCPFHEAGCAHVAERKSMKKHVKEDAESHMSMLSQSFDSLQENLKAHTEALDVHVNRLSQVETKVESLEKLYGSQLLWKIDNYNEKMTQAKSGQKTTIYSPPFLTSRHGYRMALSACLYGDGKAKGKYMSLFVCLCKGNYDPLLVWPFTHTLTLTLIDQCQDPAARRNVNYVIKPNPCKENLAFLGRPKVERNASFGAQKFVELHVLTTLDYIRDDAMYVKVTMDSEEMVML